MPPETVQVFAEAPVVIVAPVERKEMPLDIEALAELVAPSRVKVPAPVFWRVREPEMVEVPAAIVTVLPVPPELKISTLFP